MGVRKKEQSRRFKEAARELGADESGETFERAFKKIVPAKMVQIKKINGPRRNPK